MQHHDVCRSSMTEVCSCQDITLSVAAPTVARMPISAAPSRSPACRTVWPTWMSDPTALMSSPALDAACIMSQCCCTCQAQAQQGMADDDKGQLGLVQGLPYCYSVAVDITGRQNFSCFSFHGNMHMNACLSIYTCQNRQLTRTYQNPCLVQTAGRRQD